MNKSKYIIKYNSGKVLRFSDYQKCKKYFFTNDEKGKEMKILSSKTGKYYSYLYSEDFY